MAAKLTRLAHKIATQLHLVAESCNVCRSHSRWQVRKLMDIPSYLDGCIQKFPDWVDDEINNNNNNNNNNNKSHESKSGQEHRKCHNEELRVHIFDLVLFDE
jgi:hypothetical protein